MNLNDAKDTIRRLGEKWARLALLERRRAEIDAEVGRIKAEIEAMGTHAANAATWLEDAPVARPGEP